MNRRAIIIIIIVIISCKSKRKELVYDLVFNNKCQKQRSELKLLFVRGFNDEGISVFVNGKKKYENKHAVDSKNGVLINNFRIGDINNVDSILVDISGNKIAFKKNVFHNHDFVLFEINNERSRVDVVLTNCVEIVR